MMNARSGGLLRKKSSPRAVAPAVRSAIERAALQPLTVKTLDIKLLFHLAPAMDMIAPMKIPTAAILVIGDEILSGKTDDQNARLLIGELRELGVALRRIVTIPDDLEEVAAAVRELSARFDHVFTSGGVGPTHDDVTLAGVARAFDVP